MLYRGLICITMGMPAVPVRWCECAALRSCRTPDLLVLSILLRY
jgi:hypothetical protein